MVDSKAIRLVDRYVGSALCALFSLAHAFRRRPSPAPIHRVLVMELFEMGAAVLAYPALNYIRKKLPDAEIYCLCTDSVKQSWRILGCIPDERIITVSGGSPIRFCVSLLRTVIALRRLQLDLLVDLELFMRISSIVAFLSGARLKAGFNRFHMEGLFRGTYYDYPVAFNQNTHISRNFLSVVKTALLDKHDYPNLKECVASDDVEYARYRSNPEIAARMRERIAGVYPDYAQRRIVLICPSVGPTLAVRNYPRQHFVEVVKGLLSARHDVLALLVGVKGDRSVCEAICAAVAHDRCIDFCGMTADLTDLMELISLSRLIIGNDNGPLHFASMTDCRILGLFSTDSPFIYGPVGHGVVMYQFYQCSPCIFAYNHKRSRCTDNRCLQSLAPEKVCRFAQGMLEGTIAYRTINGEIPYLF